jgi:hypothetical protein
MMARGEGREVQREWGTGRSGELGREAREKSEESESEINNRAGSAKIFINFSSK